jgi:hypothetical protein
MDAVLTGNRGRKSLPTDIYMKSHPASLLPSGDISTRVVAVGEKLVQATPPPLLTRCRLTSERSPEPVHRNPILLGLNRVLWSKLGKEMSELIRLNGCLINAKDHGNPNRVAGPLNQRVIIIGRTRRSPPGSLLTH